MERNGSLLTDNAVDDDKTRGRDSPVAEAKALRNRSIAEAKAFRDRSMAEAKAMRDFSVAESSGEF